MTKLNILGSIFLMLVSFSDVTFKKNCCEKNLIVTCENVADCIDITEVKVSNDWIIAEIDNNANVQFNAGVESITTSTVTAGSGNNQGVGNRYTVTFPAHPLGTNYSVKITPIGLLGGATPNGLIDHVLIKTPTSVTYVFNSGDDGQGADEFDRFSHDLEISGETFTIEQYSFN